jgi:Uncharacterized conserved protein
MCVKGALIPLKEATFRTGTTSKLKNRGSAKRSPTVRDEGVTGSKSRTSVASARRACQRLHGADELVNYRHRYTEDELRELNRRIACTEVYALFNNLSMKEDAERFSMIVGSSQAGT